MSTEVHVRWKTGYLMSFDGIQTGTVAYARVAAWLTRYPNAKVTEKMGPPMMIIIEPGVDCPDDLRWDGDG